MEELETLRVFDNYVTAHIIKSRLEVEGVFCVLKDENTITMNWLWSNALGGIKLQVKSSDFLRAEQILQDQETLFKENKDSPGFWEEDTEQLNPDNRICIYCGSKNTRKIEYEKRPAFLMVLLLGFPLLFQSKKWHCFHCGKKF